MTDIAAATHAPTRQSRAGTRPLLTDFAPQHRELFGRHTVTLRHRLNESDLFSDARLAHLIEASPREAAHVHTMDVTTHDPRTRREGTIGDLSGAQVIDAIRTGHIWILIQNPERVDPAYGEMLAALYAELEERVPGFRSYRRKMSILVSSPGVQVYYHCDVPGQTLWQVRGSKRVYVYPNTAPFLPQPALEKIVLGEAHEISLRYEPWFDDYAQVIDLEPGMMAHWPLNCPHRVVNHASLNVSFTTEHWTDELRSAYAVTLANGVLRKALGQRRNLARPDRGLGLGLRLGLAGAYKFSGLQKRRRRPFRIDFAVDARAPHSVRDIEPFELSRG